MNNKKTICLTMIVKNESQVIRKCLHSVKPWIDHWVIVDTGSTDGTQEIIRETLREIPGELHERPWVNFGHNRNEALEYARNKADYLLLLDADEYLLYQKLASFPQLKSDAYYINVRLESSEFLRTFLISTALSWRWEGSVHEELFCEKTPFDYLVLQDFFLISSATEGARAKDPNTRLRDAALLEERYQKDPMNKRTVFYLAQTYCVIKELEKALFYFKKRSELGGNEEEVFWSLYQAAIIQELLKQDTNTVIEAYKKAYQYRPTRVEPLFGLACLYINLQRFKEACQIIKLALTVPLPTDYLYVEKWMYPHGIISLLGECAYKTKKYKEAAILFKEALSNPQLPPHIVSASKNMLQNCFCFNPEFVFRGCQRIA